MKKWKKLTLVIIAVAVMLAGIIGGTLAVSADEDTPADPEASTLLERVAEIYERNTGTALDAEQLEAAFKEAQKETCVEKRTELLDRMVENGIITQEEADELKAWFDDMPEIDFGRMHEAGIQFFEGMKDNANRFNIRGFHKYVDPGS